MIFSTPEFWVFVAFAFFIGGVWKKAHSFLTQSLDAYRQKVSHQFNEAQRLHDEAFSLLEAYKKKHQEAAEQAASILSFAETEALAFKNASQAAFEKFIAQKEKAFLERITLEKEEAKSNLKKEATEEALALVERFLSKEPKIQKKLTEAALKEVMTLVLKPASLQKTF